MAFFEYKEGEHPGGFIGIRIVVPVGKDYRQKYFSFKRIPKSNINRIRKEAKTLESKWITESKKLKKEARCLGDHHNIKQVHSTGFTGLRIFIVTERKVRGGELRHYYAPSFMARGEGDKVFRISKHGYEGAWRNAVDYVVKHHDVPRQRKAEMMKAIPDKSRFRKVRLDMMKQGHKIDMDVLRKLGL